jgi:hypothetical protein
VLVVVLGVEVVVVTVLALVTVFVRGGEVTVVLVVLVLVGCTTVVVLPTLTDGADGVDELLDELLFASSTTTTTTAATATAIPPAIAQPRPPPCPAGRSPGGGSKLSDTQVTLKHPVRDASSRSDDGAGRGGPSWLPAFARGRA